MNPFLLVLIFLISKVSAIPIPLGSTLPQWDHNRFYNQTISAQGVIDLRDTVPTLNGEYFDLIVEKRSSISISRLKYLQARHGALRITIKDSKTYMVVENSEKLTVYEYDYAFAVQKEFTKAQVPLTTELMQLTNGTGSVEASISLGLTAKFNQNFGITLDIFPQMSVAVIPGFYIGFRVNFARTSTASLSYSNSISGTASCSADAGHSVQAILDISYHKWVGIKVRKFTFENLKWIQSPVIEMQEAFNPNANIKCITK